MLGWQNSLLYASVLRTDNSFNQQLKHAGISFRTHFRVKALNYILYVRQYFALFLNSQFIGEPILVSYFFLKI